MSIAIRRACAGSFTILTLAAVAGCSSAAPEETGPAVSTGVQTLAFDHAATRASVPRDLLVAIARVEGGLDVPALRDVADETEEHTIASAGPLMLRRGKLDTLARGAELVDARVVDLRRDADLALDAGALVLAELGAKTGARSDDLGSWQRAIEEMSGYADDEHREEYAHRVFATLARGGRFAGRDGETVVLPKHDLPPSLTLDVSFRLRTMAVAQYPGAEWIPTSCANNKCTVGRGGAKVEVIVVHDTEGGWDASVATLQNDPGKSVQYIIGTDGKVGQFVTEDTTAYHAGNFYFNQRSVGIEHVGYATKPFTEAEYAASAKLVDYLAKKYGVPKDRAHVIGHDQIPNGTKIAQSSAPCSASPKSCQSNTSYGGASHHTDPGIWEWATYMTRFGGSAKCNDVTAIWNCSNDKKQAFRCAGGKVIVETCDGPGGCEVKPTGVDDVCHVQPKSTPPPAGTGTTSEPPPGASPPPGTSETTGAPVPGPAAPGGDLAPPPEDEATGCQTSGRGGGASPVGAGLAGLALAIAWNRRRSRRA
ncbi:MAG: N-acetylmuramoyl-L-alanine amidase [Deltaproteobacteria bacterium]|nr:N-acetylmuramoyl-L-alanine amidase [Deltaproteobacteria bacterium]